MNVYDGLIRMTRDILKDVSYRELRVNKDVSWNLLDTNEFIMQREVAFELGDRFKPCSVYTCPTSTKELVNEDRIILIGKDLKDIKENTNFSRIVFLNIDDIENQNKAYIGVKKLDYQRYKMIPEGYMILSSSFENRENIRVSKKAIKKGLSFEILGNLYINHYKKLEGVNNAIIVFIVGDYDFNPELCKLSKYVDEVTDNFDHVLKNVILDCEACPLKAICEDIEELRELHFKQIAERDKALNDKKK